jgi:RNA polymerase sigma-70 factor (ECF subfamily)
MRRHNERVYRAARAIVQNDAEVEDVMQQAYVNAYAHLRRFNHQAQFSTWLTRIVINESLARVRHKQRYQPFDEEQSNVETFVKQDGTRSPEREAASEELRVLLESAIDRLPNGAREVFMLREVERYEHCGGQHSPRNIRGCREDALSSRPSDPAPRFDGADAFFGA